MRQLNRVVLTKSFWRSLAGSLNLYSSHSVPAPVRVDITPLRVAIVDPTDAMRADWVQTGMDIESAITEYRDKRHRKPDLA
jgi:hypothetical protein